MPALAQLLGHFDTHRARAIGRQTLVLGVVLRAGGRVGREGRPVGVEVHVKARCVLRVQAHLGCERPAVGQGLHVFGGKGVGQDVKAVFVVAVAQAAGAAGGVDVVVPAQQKRGVVTLVGPLIKDFVGVRVVAHAVRKPGNGLHDVALCEHLRHAQGDFLGVFGLVGGDVVAGVDAVV